MVREKYLSIRKNVSGFSFANLGLFTGFGDSIVNTVYSLVLLGIFTQLFNENVASSAVGIYVGIYSVYCVIVGLFANEILRLFSKSKLLYIVMFLVGMCYAMMSFSIAPQTFVILDYLSGTCTTLIGMLIPLFMADFSKNIGMEKLNARYHLWTNIGALLAPFFALTIATKFDSYRAPFLATSIIYFSGLLFFRHFGIVQQDKEVQPTKVKKLLRALRINTIMFFKTPGMARAYIVNFGYYALRAMRLLYVPIIVIEKGFSNETLSIVLTAGILPYIIIETFIGKLVKKYGVRLWLTIGLLSFSLFSIVASFASGYVLLSMFVLWQISGAFMEAVHDLLFFNSAKKTEQARFYGVFRTSANFPSVIAPMIGAVCIAIFGSTSAVWLVTATVGVLSTIVLLSKND
ncbi:MAG: MFS transporter [Alphaproteobacteria bacterium]|nr:MFS transporter [Alphaproteobacteria bacterium]